MNVTENLITCAKQLGATKCKIIGAKQVIVDRRVGLKCMVPLCQNYGRNLMCPPRVMTPDQFSQVLQAYQQALLVMITSAVPKAYLSNDREGMPNFFEDPGYKQVADSGALAMHELVGKLEAEAFSLGYRLAAGLIGGHCRLCEECCLVSGSTNCPHPYKARPPMEAMGIDVLATCERAGLAFEIPAKDVVSRVGLVLLD